MKRVKLSELYSFQKFYLTDKSKKLSYRKGCNFIATKGPKKGKELTTIRRCETDFKKYVDPNKIVYVEE